VYGSQQFDLSRLADHVGVVNVFSQWTPNVDVLVKGAKAQSHD